MASTNPTGGWTFPSLEYMVPANVPYYVPPAQDVDYEFQSEEEDSDSDLDENLESLGAAPGKRPGVVNSDIVQPAFLSRVPVEIYSRIFMLNLPSHETNDEPAPWTVSQVCYRWREIVLAQRGLWTFIDVRSHRRKKFTNTFRLKTQLRRSGDLPLDIQFSAQQHVYVTDEIVLTRMQFDTKQTSPDESVWAFTSQDLRMLQILAKHAARWEKFSMDAPKGLWDHLSASLGGEFALLRVLKVELEAGKPNLEDDGLEYDDSGPAVSLLMFEDAPRLEEVSLNLNYRHVRVSAALPFEQLLRFAGHNNWDGHLRTLRSAHNLVECKLQVEQVHDGRPPVLPKPILLPRLKRLAVFDGAFLQYIDASELNELHTRYHPTTLPAFLRQTPKLTKLILGGDIESTPLINVTPLLQVVNQTLTFLALMLPPPTAFFSDFADASLDLAPILETLMLNPIYQDDAAQRQDDLLRAAETRWRKGTLRRVRIPKPLQPGVEERIALLQKEGLDIQCQRLWEIRDQFAFEFSVNG
ncbi:F-box domain-containing protein [Favolaschia claudopus]|uniref:F-box domain-containing protein n=1 Tax=Favolaschia claudopus TaxID=2862362 RepID=A0AAW0D0I0_9AGAR